MRCSGPGLEWGKAHPFIAVEDRRPTCHVPFSLSISPLAHTPDSHGLPQWCPVSALPERTLLTTQLHYLWRQHIHYSLADSQNAFDWQGGHVSGWQAEWRVRLDSSHDVLDRLEPSSQPFDEYQRFACPDNMLEL